MAVGSIALPAAVSAASPGFKLTLQPAIAVVAPSQHSLEFLLVNSGNQLVSLNASASDSWVTLAETSFTIAAGQRHMVKATVAIPLGADAGDHETDVTFVIPPPDGSLIRIAYGIQSRVLIDAGGSIVHGLHVFGLTAPWIADSFDSPTVNLRLSNQGNIHEIVTVAPFGQVLVTRGQSKTLSLAWTHHPFLGVGTISAGGESVSTLFLPWRLALGLLALFAGLLLVRQVRRSR